MFIAVYRLLSQINLAINNALNQFHTPCAERQESLKRLFLRLNKKTPRQKGVFSEYSKFANSVIYGHKTLKSGLTCVLYLTTMWYNYYTVAPLPKKVKKKTPAQIRKILWEHCKRITRKRYMNKDGTWNCYTCGRIIDEPVKAQTGHFIPSSTCGAFLRYDLRNLRVQDYYCNINLGGNGSEYYRRMVLEVGQDKVDQLFQDKNKIVKGHDHNLQLLTEYEKL